MIKIFKKESLAQLTPHLSNKEFACKCVNVACTATIFNTQLGDVFEKLREKCGGQKLTVLSGYRCPAHNRWQDLSSPTSWHMAGMAIDIAPPENITLPEFSKLMLESGAAFSYNKPDRGFAHMDIRPV